MARPHSIPRAVLAAAAVAGLGAASPPAVHVRASQLGLETGAAASAVVFSARELRGTYAIVDEATGRRMYRAPLPAPACARWGRWRRHYRLDLGAAAARPGRYVVHAGGARAAFQVGGAPWKEVAAAGLEFLRQQRCGYNPFLDVVCHPYDSRTAYGPAAPGSYLDARGGWHDAGDQLKYLLTSSTAAAHLLLAHRIAPGLFEDGHDALGRPGGNGEADVLDEARWGIEWMLRLHPEPGQLYHQVADDRDHIGWKLPHEDASDYGWGKGRDRVVYFADGRPQGLRQYQSESDGVANLAGRYAAAMALAYGAWKDDPRGRGFAERCLRAGREVYALGMARPGVQQGNSFGAPYRYGEETWADDMEWGAAELFRATGERAYLDEAVGHARRAAATSWMGARDVRHYQFYPFMNLGHFALHEASDDPRLRLELAGHYRRGLELVNERAQSNAHGIGVPFIWCSNNLVVALVTQGLLHERMTGDARFRALAADHRDWLFGRNPWGVSMMTGVPASGLFPRAPHLSTTHLTGRAVRGGLVDGPVYASIFQGLKGAALSGPDVLADFQGEAVYHDDVADYASNEPTMDGTASAVLMAALLGAR